MGRPRAANRLRRNGVEFVGGVSEAPCWRTPLVPRGDKSKGGKVRRIEGLRRIAAACLTIVSLLGPEPRGNLDPTVGAVMDRMGGRVVRGEEGPLS